MNDNENIDDKGATDAVSCGGEAPCGHAEHASRHAERELNHALAHAHGSSGDSDVDSGLKKRLAVAICFTGIIFIVELIGGYWTNSLALISDAAHVLMDVVALSLSLFAIHISALPPTEKRTYGLHRAEVLVAFINGMTIVLVALYIFYKAYFRFINPEPVESVGMLVVAFVGLVVNALVAMWLMRYAASDLNVRSAYLHVVGDALASVGVIIGAAVIYNTGWYQADAVISVVIGLILFYGAGRIVLESTHILLEGVPKEIDFSDVVEDIGSIEGVRGVHSLHIWSICHNIYALSAHIDVLPGIESRKSTQRCLIGYINDILSKKHQIYYTTLQLQCNLCERNSTLRSMRHSEKDGGHQGHSH
jgi:cobalt-zinc-cadmium efflux system protein